MVSIFPNHAELDTPERASAFGLLCSSRLLAVAAVGNFPCAADLGAIVRDCGECAGDTPQVVALKMYSARFPYRDDVESPNYYRSLSVDLALMSIELGGERPADRARRLMFMATQAWGNLDDILSSRGSTSEDFCHREMGSQIRDISLISSARDVKSAYFDRLLNYREEYRERAAYFARVASLLGWS